MFKMFYILMFPHDYYNEACKTDTKIHLLGSKRLTVPHLLCLSVFSCKMRIFVVQTPLVIMRFKEDDAKFQMQAIVPLLNASEEKILLSLL